MTSVPDIKAINSTSQCFADCPSLLLRNRSTMVQNPFKRIDCRLLKSLKHEMKNTPEPGCVWLNLMWKYHFLKKAIFKDLSGGKICTDTPKVLSFATRTAGTSGASFGSLQIFLSGLFSTPPVEWFLIQLQGISFIHIMHP